jgi:hypothetical protein
MSQHYTMCPTCQRPTSSIDENGRVHVYTLTLQSVADTIDAKQKAAPAMYEALQKILAIKRTVDLNLFDIEAIHSIAEAALRAADGGE